MVAEPFRGVYPILITPFDERDRIDEEDLRRLVDYCIAEGVHGFGLAFGTETPKLTETERARVAELVIEQSRGRVPVVVNIGAPSAYATVLYSQRMQDLGADGVMCVPPPASSPGVGRGLTSKRSPTRFAFPSSCRRPAMPSEVRS